MFFSLAECYEELARYYKAKVAYNNALQFGSNDPTILGGYASFLSLRGEASEALGADLKLLQIESAQGNQSAAENTKFAIRTLAGKLGMLMQSIDEQIT